MPVRGRAFIRSIGLAVALVAVSPSARADAQSDAKDLFMQGQSLRESGDCAAAAALFRKSYAIYPAGLGSLRNLATCEEQIGHFASARRAWLDLSRALVTAPNDPKYAGWTEDAEREAARLAPKVAQVHVDVIVKSPQSEGPATERSGVDLFINGEKVAPSLIGTTLERDPGSYLFRAQTSDATPVEHTVVITAGEKKNVTLRLERHPHLTPEQVEQNQTAKARKLYGWIAIGVGGAALVGSGITFLMRQGALSDLKNACGEDRYETGPCPTSSQDAIDRGSAMSVLSPVLLGVGLVGIGAGVTLMLTAPKTTTTGAAPTAPGKGWTLNGGLGRVDATWRF